jgi:HEAT repeat protein
MAPSARATAGRLASLASLAALAALAALARPAAAQYLGAFRDAYLLEILESDYSEVPNKGDRVVDFVVGGSVRVRAGPQADFDRFREVLKLVRHKERRYRLAAVIDLERYRNMRAARAITSLLGDPDYEVRETAAWALGEMGYRSAIRPLVDTLSWTRGPARETVAHALRKLTGKDFGTSYRRWWAWYEAVRRDY